MDALSSWNHLFDENTGGVISRTEYIAAVQDNEFAEYLQHDIVRLPKHTRQENCTRRILIKVFDDMDENQNGLLAFHDIINYLRYASDSLKAEMEAAAANTRAGGERWSTVEDRTAAAKEKARILALLKFEMEIEAARAKEEKEFRLESEAAAAAAAAVKDKQPARLEADESEEADPTAAGQSAFRTKEEDVLKVEADAEATSFWPAGDGVSREKGNTMTDVAVTALAKARAEGETWSIEEEGAAKEETVALVAEAAEQASLTVIAEEGIPKDKIEAEIKTNPQDAMFVREDFRQVSEELATLKESSAVVTEEEPRPRHLTATDSPRRPWTRSTGPFEKTFHVPPPSSPAFDRSPMLAHKLQQLALENDREATDTPAVMKRTAAATATSINSHHSHKHGDSTSANRHQQVRITPVVLQVPPPPPLLKKDNRCHQVDNDEGGSFRAPWNRLEAAISAGKNSLRLCHHQ